MRHLLLLTPLLATACSFPQFVAQKTIELELPLQQASALSCRTHNGDIVVSNREQTADTVMVRAELKVRGNTQQEADDNLHLLKLAHAIDGDTLKIQRDFPRQTLNGMSPSYSFTLMVPAHLALKLHTHNGDITTSGTSGALAIHTHNGDVQSQAETCEVAVETHNGSVELALPVAGTLQGKVKTHNGDIWIDVHDDASGWIEAKTHNGGIDMPDKIHDATIKRRSVRCRIGEQSTEGKLNVRTHNGNVKIR